MGGGTNLLFAQERMRVQNFTVLCRLVDLRDTVGTRAPLRLLVLFSIFGEKNDQNNRLTPHLWVVTISLRIPGSDTVSAFFFILQWCSIYSTTTFFDFTVALLSNSIENFNYRGRLCRNFNRLWNIFCVSLKPKST